MGDVFRALLLAAALAVLGCSGSGSGTATETGTETGAGTDTGTDTDTAASTDTGTDTDTVAGTKTAWGNITGLCDGLLIDPGNSKPQFHVNTYHFATATKFDPKALSKGAKKRYEGPNAGGSSKCSEVMSMQLFVDCAAAKIHKTEIEIKYSKKGSITDYMLEFKGEKYGVSVTRAYKGPTITTYTEKDAVTLLTKKLKGVNDSTANVSAEDKWKRQILHIWTLRPLWIGHLQAAWQKMPAALMSDTIVVVTVELGTSLIVADKCE